MERPRRWSVLGGLVILTALAWLPDQQMAWAAQDKADKPAEQRWVVDRSLTLTPRGEPVPVLQYELFPLASELKEGNAVPIYDRLVHEQSDEAQRRWKEKPAAWNKLPLEQLPVQEAKQFLEKYASRQLRQLELGARRRSAEWNYTLDEGDPISILLPDAQMMRVYAGLLVLKARIELAERDYTAAARTLETGFAFSRHVAEGPFLINGLVAVAIDVQLTDALLDWVGQADAPNLYWSLTALPTPLLDLRKGMEFEQRMEEMQFPDLADLKRERSPAEWDAALKRIRSEFERIMDISKESPDYKKDFLPGSASTDPPDRSQELPAAKKYLIERGQLPAANVDAMPPAQVLVLYRARVNQEYRDDFFKGVYLPVPQALPVLAASEKRWRSAPASEAMAIPRTFLPALGKVLVNTTRLERKVAALRVIEALRLYAAAHDGRLPDKLADVSEVPIPNDPGTQRPFEYSRENDVATLIAPPLEVHPRLTGQRYRLTMKAKD